MTLFPPGDVTGNCAVGVWRDLCAADGGSDGFGGCKAHGLILLVKTCFSGLPSLCCCDVLVCSHSSFAEMLSYCY